MLISSDELIISLITLEDAPFILKLLNEESYIKNIRDSEVRTIDEAKTFITKMYLDSYSRLGFGLYLVKTKDHNPVGICGLVKRDDFPIPDLGFAISETFQSKKYATGAARLLLVFAKNKLHLDEIAGITTKANQGSQKVLLRSGFKFEGLKNLTGKDYLYYHIKL